MHGRTQVTHGPFWAKYEWKCPMFCPFHKGCKFRLIPAGLTWGNEESSNQVTVAVSLDVVRHIDSSADVGRNSVESQQPANVRVHMCVCNQLLVNLERLGHEKSARNAQKSVFHVFCHHNTDTTGVAGLHVLVGGGKQSFCLDLSIKYM